MDIQPYSDQYKKQVTELILAIQNEEFGIAIGLQAQPDLNDIPGFYQQNKGNFWIALKEDKVIGTIALLDIGDSQGALRKMFVHAGYRGKTHQAGQSLLHALLEWSVTKELKDIYLGTTEKFLAAHRFYEKNGFTAIAKSLLPDRFPVMSVDTKFYKYVIN